MKLFVLMLCLSFFPGGVLYAQTAGDKLNLALKSLDNLKADFKQTVLDDNQQVVRQSSGYLAIQRPGKFAWIYTSPFEQQIIADGSELWVYDVELDQVTVKPMDSGLASAPIMILMKQNDISEEFSVSEVGQRKYLYWVELEPNTKDMEYTNVFIGLEGNTVKAMELRDSFGQSTQIVFENLRTDVIHNPETFKFTPPPGVDVFGVGG
jgi:outer membrane lipoprotein carrier protein